MKAITISQPHASAIFFIDPDERKRIESRKREHPWQNFRGLLLIHAGQGTQFLSRKKLNDFPSGFLGVVEVPNVLHRSHLERARDAGQGATLVTDTDMTVNESLRYPGPNCIFLANARKFREPIPCSGKQGLWNAPEELEAVIAAAIETAEVLA